MTLFQLFPGVGGGGSLRLSLPNGSTRIGFIHEERMKDLADAASVAVTPRKMKSSFLISNFDPSRRPC